MTFYVDEVALKVTCDGIPNVDPTHWTLQSATNRNCSLDLEVVPNSAGEDLSSEFCAGSCASGASLLSLYTNTNDLEFTAVPGSLVCDGGNLDDRIPQILEGFVPKVAAEATQSLLAGILDYRNKPNSLVPFPPIRACAPRRDSRRRDESRSGFASLTRALTQPAGEAGANVRVIAGRAIETHPAPHPSASPRLSAASRYRAAVTQQPSQTSYFCVSLRVGSAPAGPKDSMNLSLERGRVTTGFLFLKV